MVDGYWPAVLANGGEMPLDRPLDELTAELVSMLGDADPFRRVATATTLLARWVAGGAYDDLLPGVGDGLVAGLLARLGENGTDSVLRRSYSARVLADVVGRDNDRRLLTDDTVLRWGDAGARWLLGERDLRETAPGLGPVRTVTHAAELLGALARSRHFGAAELAVLLDVLADRLLQPTEHRLGAGEDDRLAYAVMAILHRDVVDATVSERWVARVGAALRDPEQHPAGHATVNTRDVLRALYLQLAIGVRGRTGTSGDQELFARPPRDRADLLLATVEQLRLSTPWLFGPARGRALAPSAR